MEEQITPELVKLRQIERANDLAAQQEAARKEAREHAQAMSKAQLDRATRERAMEKAMMMQGASLADDQEAFIKLAIRIEQYLKDGN